MYCFIFYICLCIFMFLKLKLVEKVRVHNQVKSRLILDFVSAYQIPGCVWTCVQSLSNTCFCNFSVEVILVCW